MNLTDTQKQVVIIDYNLSNLFSVEHACRHVGLEPLITSDADTIAQANALILPGVGAFGESMNHMHNLGQVEAIKHAVAQGGYLLGVCLGLQLLFERSEEFGSHEGLGLIPGGVKKFPAETDQGPLRVPHVGWNTIHHGPASTTEMGHQLLGKLDGEHMYFVHSYYVVPDNNEHILTTTEYQGLTYCSSVCKDTVVATQFHPEKSGRKGVEIYKNWAETVFI